MEALTRDLDGKLKLEDVPESDPKAQSDPVSHRPDYGRPYYFSGLDAEVAPEGGVAASEGPGGEASQRSDVVEALAKEMESKLKLEGSNTASSKGSRPPEEASSIPETQANSSPQKTQQTFSFTFDEGNLQTATSPGRSIRDRTLNPSAPVWTPSPLTTKEHPLPLRLREGPAILKLPTDPGDRSRGAGTEASQEAKQQTSGSEQILKNDEDLQRSVGNKEYAGTETQIKVTSSDPRVVNAKDDRKSQTLCRNILIYGHCLYEELGCGFKHS